jgi:hypothetical protein
MFKKFQDSSLVLCDFRLSLTNLTNPKQFKLTNFMGATRISYWSTFIQRFY